VDSSLTIFLNAHDTAYVKTLPSMLADPSSTSLSIGSGFASGVSSLAAVNPLAAMFVPDTSAPRAQSAGFEASTGVLRIVFDDAMSSITSLSALTIFNAAVNVTLTGSVSVTVVGFTLAITLRPLERTAVERLFDADPHGVYLLFTVGFVTDAAGNNATAVEGGAALSVAYSDATGAAGSNGLATAAIAGIAAGGALFLLLLLVVLVIVLRNRRHQHRKQTVDGLEYEDDIGNAAAMRYRATGSVVAISVPENIVPVDVDLQLVARTDFVPAVGAAGAGVRAGEHVTCMHVDVEQGWLIFRTAAGKQGRAPVSLFDTATAGSTVPPAAGEVPLVAVQAYKAMKKTELSVAVGERVVSTPATGLPQGWITVTNAGGQAGLVPAARFELAADGVTLGNSSSSVPVQPGLEEEDATPRRTTAFRPADRSSVNRSSRLSLNLRPPSILLESGEPGESSDTPLPSRSSRRGVRGAVPVTDATAGDGGDEDAFETTTTDPAEEEGEYIKVSLEERMHMTARRPTALKDSVEDPV
jgi:hypothetical protein